MSWRKDSDHLLTEILMKQKHQRNMANMLTGLRIVCSVALLFFPPLSPAFYAIYIAAGLTDMIDGTVARKTGSVSAFGAKFDTVADAALVAACLVKLLPVLDVPLWLYVWIGVIALVKAVNLISGYVMRKKWIAPHTVMNKIAGALLFVLPLTLHWIDLKYSAIVVCAVAAFAAVQEGHFIRTGRDNKKRKDG